MKSLLFLHAVTDNPAQSEPVTTVSNCIIFSVGETFNDFQELESKRHAFEQANFVQLWKRDCRTVAAAKKRLDRHLDEKLKYYEVKYCCVHGGQSFRAKGNGARSTW